MCGFDINLVPLINIFLFTCCRVESRCIALMGTTIKIYLNTFNHEFDKLPWAAVKLKYIIKNNQLSDHFIDGWQKGQLFLLTLCWLFIFVFYFWVIFSHFCHESFCNSKMICHEGDNEENIKKEHKFAS